MGQNLRFALLFLLSLNRLIIEKYGGKTKVEDFMRGNFSKTSSDFCDDYEWDWGWRPSEGFGWEPRPSFWFVFNLLVCLFLFYFATRLVSLLEIFIKSVLVQKRGEHMQQKSHHELDEKCQVCF